MKYKLVLVVLVIFAAAISVLPTQAQEVNQIEISVSPTVFELSANPGQTLNESFKIVNGTDADLKLNLTNKNFTPSGEEGAVDLTEDGTSFALASWITVTPSTLVLPARGSQTFDFSVAVPDNAEPGGHFGSIIAKTEAEAIDATGAKIAQEIGPLILVKVAGDITEIANIASFEPNKSFYENGPIVLDTRLQNTGNVHFKPRGTVVIKNMFGSEVTTINLEEKNVLPDSIRKLVSEWSPGFTVGRYTADLSLVYGADDTILTSSTTFIVFPYKVVVPALIGGILLLFVLVRYRDRFGEAARVLSGSK